MLGCAQVCGGLGTASVWHDFDNRRANEFRNRPGTDAEGADKNLATTLMHMSKMSIHSESQLVTARLVLKCPTVSDSASVLAYRVSNRKHLRPWEPERLDQFYTIQSVESQLCKLERQTDEKSAQYWLLRAQGSSGEVIGECSFTNIIQGPFKACYLGFSLGSEYQGLGFMHEALQVAIPDIFESHGLHRIMANFQPCNYRSEKLLHRLGFEREGLAKEYLKINGKWADHVLTSLLNLERAMDV
jgi:ribosomal-protein-alanine N-acetyltransferase